MRENEAKIGLGLLSICTKSTYSIYIYIYLHIYIYIYQCVNELIYHISIHGAMGQWCELT